MVISNKSPQVEGRFAQALPSAAGQLAGAGVLGALVGAALAWGLVGDVWAVACGLAVYAVAIVLAVSGLRAGYPHPVIGLCNLATLARLVLVCVLIAALLAPAPPPWPVFAVAVLAFALDGLDGWLARRDGLSSAFGARFDMEVDSLLALTLALLAWQSGTVGAYVVILGLPRYAFWVAQFPFPWLNGDLPERFSRKVVCVVQIAALILALFPLVPAGLASGFAGVAALALVWSFGTDVAHLWRPKA